MKCKNGEASSAAVTIFIFFSIIFYNQLEMEKRDESGARMCEEQHLVSSISLLRNENGSVADVAIGLFISKEIV